MSSKPLSRQTCIALRLHAMVIGVALPFQGYNAWQRIFRSGSQCRFHLPCVCYRALLLLLCSPLSSRSGQRNAAHDETSDGGHEPMRPIACWNRRINGKECVVVRFQLAFRCHARKVTCTSGLVSTSLLFSEGTPHRTCSTSHQDGKTSLYWVHLHPHASRT